ncbi:MAG: hypothetical protein ABJC66_06960 [Gammaproteobacteria bacterium]
MKIEAMLWILVLMSLALALVSRQYRKYGLAVVGVAVLAIVAIIVFARQDEAQTPASKSVPTQRSQHIDFERSHVAKLDRLDPEAKNRIALAEIRFEQIRPAADSEPGSFESIRARLYNDSARFKLTDYGYYLVVQDCLATVCTTIYDQRGLESAAIPANQARDVKIAIRADETPGLPPFKLVGSVNIILSPTETRAFNGAATP